jgi:hypothetical protein
MTSTVVFKLFFPSMTGPTMSGKSTYLKQVRMQVILRHVELQIDHAMSTALLVSSWVTDWPSHEHSPLSQHFYTKSISSKYEDDHDGKRHKRHPLLLLLLNSWLLDFMSPTSPARACCRTYCNEHNCPHCHGSLALLLVISTASLHHQVAGPTAMNIMVLIAMVP